jgi:hypothetical protein
MPMSEFTPKCAKKPEDRRVRITMVAPDEGRTHAGSEARRVAVETGRMEAACHLLAALIFAQRGWLRSPVRGEFV